MQKFSALPPAADAASHNPAPATCAAPVLELAAASFRALKQARAARGRATPPGAPAPEPWLLLSNALVVDVAAGQLLGGGIPHDVAIQGTRIIEVAPHWHGTAAAQAAEAASNPAAAAQPHPKAPSVVAVDCTGLTLCPGLCDAHVHCTAATADLAGLRSLPESYVTARAAHTLGGMLARGFTTVRVRCAVPQTTCVLLLVAYPPCWLTKHLRCCLTY